MSRASERLGTHDAAARDDSDHDDGEYVKNSIAIMIVSMMNMIVNAIRDCDYDGAHDGNMVVNIMKTRWWT